MFLSTAISKVAQLIVALGGGLGGEEGLSYMLYGRTPTPLGLEVGAEGADFYIKILKT